MLSETEKLLIIIHLTIFDYFLLFYFLTQCLIRNSVGLTYIHDNFIMFSINSIQIGFQNSITLSDTTQVKTISFSQTDTAVVPSNMIEMTYASFTSFSRLWGPVIKSL